MSKTKKEQKTNNNFIDFEKIKKNKKLNNIIITATGMGKTTNFSKHIRDEVINNGKIFAWIRRSIEEIRNTVVPDFQYLFNNIEGAKVTLKGVNYKGVRKIFFISLSQYANYKSLTFHDNEKIEWIIFDEAIPLNFNPRSFEWIIMEQRKPEEEKLQELFNILLRNNKEGHIFYLCNAINESFWLVQKYLPEFTNKDKKEKIILKKDLFVYSKGLAENTERGIIDKLESKEKQKITRGGGFKERAELNIKEIDGGNYIYTIFFNNSQLHLFKKHNIYYFTNTQYKTKKTIVFKNYEQITPNTILQNQNNYTQFLIHLIRTNKLYFNNLITRNNIINIIVK